jgi:hypothetical protein
MTNGNAHAPLSASVPTIKTRGSLHFSCAESRERCSIGYSQIRLAGADNQGD